MSTNKPTDENNNSDTGSTSQVLDEQKSQTMENLVETQHTGTTENIIEDFEKELAAEKDRFIRLFAEFENFKKRNIKERIELIKYANAEMMYSLLPVIDDFERALKSLENADEPVKEGVQLIYNKFKTLLEQKGLQPMECIGKPFDPDLHDAITNIPVDESKKGMVIDEAEKGYFLNGKVLRHSKVIVGN